MHHYEYTNMTRTGTTCMFIVVVQVLVVLQALSGIVMSDKVVR